MVRKLENEVVVGSRFSVGNIREIAWGLVSVTRNSIYSAFSLVEGAVDTVTFDPSKRRSQFLFFINKTMSSIQTFFSQVSATGSSRGSWLKSRAISILSLLSKDALHQADQVRKSYLNPLSEKVSGTFSSLWNQSARATVEALEKTSSLTHETGNQISSFVRTTAEKISSSITYVLNKAQGSWTFTKAHLSRAKGKIQNFRALAPCKISSLSVQDRILKPIRSLKHIDRKHVGLAAGAVSAVGLSYVAWKSVSNFMDEILKHYHNLSKEQSFNSSVWPIASLVTATTLSQILYIIHNSRTNTRLSALSKKIDENARNTRRHIQNLSTNYFGSFNQDLRDLDSTMGTVIEESKQLDQVWERLQRATSESNQFN